MKSINAYYVKRGFDIVELRENQQFLLARAVLADMDIDLNTFIKNKHVPEIECLNKTMKEWILSMYTELIRVYFHVAGVIVRKLVYTVAFCLNSFSTKEFLYTTLRPLVMITGQFVEFTKHFLLEFGEYVHTHEDGDNSM